MSIVNKLLETILAILSSILPVFPVSQQFFTTLDNAISWFVLLLQSANYFIPLDLYVVCFTCMIAIDNFGVFLRVALFVVKLIRG
jgi:hypothetical protein